ncbi:MAG TPA: hypothetical protein ENG83_04620 [Nitrospirae bacterium]|nr:hypothetical protein BMS3Abin06_00649 [bacterium BMS3Abin06]HDH11474.1 hypothetical protein [Nitrospirota bacterium]HDZ01372.1 hypothetical protein [Nitrospirota bacterium]
MIDKTRKSLATGVTRIKWVARFLAERTKAETSVAKLLYESSKLENKIDDLCRDIGRRIVELGETAKEEGKDVLKDFIVQQSLDEVRHLKESVDNYKHQAGNIGKLPE